MVEDDADPKKQGTNTAGSRTADHERPPTMPGRATAVNGIACPPYPMSATKMGGRSLRPHSRAVR